MCDLLEEALDLFTLLFMVLLSQDRNVYIRDKGFTQANDTKILLCAQPCLLYKQETDIISLFKCRMVWYISIAKLENYAMVNLFNQKFFTLRKGLQ